MSNEQSLSEQGWVTVVPDVYGDCAGQCEVCGAMARCCIHDRQETNPFLGDDGKEYGQWVVVATHHYCGQHYREGTYIDREGKPLGPYPACTFTSHWWIEHRESADMPIPAP